MPVTSLRHTFITKCYSGKCCLDSKCFSRPSAYHIFSLAAWTTRGSSFHGSSWSWPEPEPREKWEARTLFAFPNLSNVWRIECSSAGVHRISPVIRLELCLSISVFYAKKHVMPVSLTWLTWYLPAFSRVKSPVSLLKLIIDLRKDTLGLCKYAVSIKLLTNNFSTHWWPSPESVKTMVILMAIFLLYYFYAFIGWHSSLSKSFPCFVY